MNNNLYKICGIFTGFYILYNNKEKIRSKYNNFITNLEVKSIIIESITKNTFGLKFIKQAKIDAKEFQVGWNFDNNEIQKILNDNNINNKFNKIIINNMISNYPYYNRLLLKPDYDNKILNIELSD